MLFMHQATQKGSECASSPASGSFSSSWCIRCMRAPRCPAGESPLTHAAGKATAHHSISPLEFPGTEMHESPGLGCYLCTRALRSARNAPVLLLRGRSEAPGASGAWELHVVLQV